IDEEHAVVRRDADAVGILKNALSPRPDEVAIAIEDHIRMVGSGEYVDVVLRVDPNSPNLAPNPSRGQLAPPLNQLVPPLSHVDDHRILPCLAVPGTAHRRRARIITQRGQWARTGLPVGCYPAERSPTRARNGAAARLSA